MLPERAFNTESGNYNIQVRQTAFLSPSRIL